MAFLRYITLGIVAASLHSTAAFALSTDPLIEGAKLCTHHLPRYERQYGIPTHLLSAIASTESGRYHDGLRIRIPWPWTINAEGKGYYFDTKSQAIAAAQKLRNSGVKSMDVGCMQVNLYHHADAFTTLEQAFDPENNIAYAATFLRNLYQEDGSWKRAAAAYHSKTPQLGQKYVGLVYNSWYTIIDKLRAARMNVPASSVNGLKEMANAGPITSAAAPAKTSKAKWVRLSEQKGRTIAQHKTPRMNSISVSNVASEGFTTRRENGIIIMSSNTSDNAKPAAKAPSETMVIAQAKEAVNELLTAAPVAAAPASFSTPNPKIITIDGSRSVNNISLSKKAGPNFIFND